MTNKHLSSPGDQKQTGKLKNRIQRNESWESGMGDINILHVLLVHPLPCVCVCVPGCLWVCLCVFFHAIFENEKTKSLPGVQNRAVNAF